LSNIFSILKNMAKDWRLRWLMDMVNRHCAV
jgi:hypothetical protein